MLFYGLFNETYLYFIPEIVNTCTVTTNRFASQLGMTSTEPPMAVAGILHFTRMIYLPLTNFCM